MLSHCCEQMNFHIHEKEKIIYYDSVLKEYAIRVTKNAIQCISFCPWCGSRLPDDLRDKWFNEMEVLGIDPHREARKIPKEFKTDEWWKKRGL